MPVIAILTGKMNLRDSFCSFYITLPAIRDNPFLGVVADDRGTKGVTKINRAQSRSSVKYCMPEFVGGIVETAYNVDDGKILRVTGVRQTGRVGFRHTHCLNLRVREGAALRRVIFRPNENPDRDFNEFYLYGRMDILGPDEARALGAVIPESMASAFDEEPARRAFEVKVDAEEVSRPASVSVVEVADATGVVVKRRRSFKFGA